VLERRFSVRGKVAVAAACSWSVRHHAGRAGGSSAQSNARSWLYPCSRSRRGTRIRVEGTMLGTAPQTPAPDVRHRRTPALSNPTLEQRERRRRSRCRSGRRPLRVPMRSLQGLAGTFRSRLQLVCSGRVVNVSTDACSSRQTGASSGVAEAAPGGADFGGQDPAWALGREDHRRRIEKGSSERIPQ
jgi:hypothetical protein